MRFFSICSNSTSTKYGQPDMEYFENLARLPEIEARGGDSHMNQTGMLVVSLRGINFGFWSRLGSSGESANI